MSPTSQCGGPGAGRSFLILRLGYFAWHQMASLVLRRKEQTQCPLLGKVLLSNGETAPGTVLWSVSFQNSCWSSYAQCDGVSMWAFGMWLGHECGALMNGISVLRKDNPLRSLTPSILWGQNQKFTVYILEEGSHQSLNILVPWSWTSQPPELWEVNFCCW